VKVQNKPEALKVAEAIHLTQDGSNLTARLSLPANDVVELLKANAARKARERAARTAGK
jgi:hypothetical protein